MQDIRPQIWKLDTGPEKLSRISNMPQMFDHATRKGFRKMEMTDKTADMPERSAAHALPDKLRCVFECSGVAVYEQDDYNHSYNCQLCEGSFMPCLAPARPPQAGPVDVDALKRDVSGRFPMMTAAEAIDYAASLGFLRQPVREGVREPVAWTRFECASDLDPERSNGNNRFETKVTWDDEQKENVMWFRPAPTDQGRAQMNTERLKDYDRLAETLGLTVEDALRRVARIERDARQGGQPAATGAQEMEPGRTETDRGAPDALMAMVRELVEAVQTHKALYESNKEEGMAHYDAAQAIIDAAYALTETGDSTPAHETLEDMLARVPQGLAITFQYPIDEEEHACALSASINARAIIGTGPTPFTALANALEKIGGGQ